MDIRLVYMTAGSPEEARHIGKTLVAARLAACVNMITPMESIYRWDGEIQQDTEVVLIAKTTSRCLPELVETVKSVHSYDCPCIVGVPVSGGNSDFLQWIASETK